MEIRKKVRLMHIVTAVFLVVFLVFSVYFFFILSANTYVGIRVEGAGGQWLAKRLQLGGAAIESGVEVGDKVLLVDDRPAAENEVLNRWLIVEQADSITVAKTGNEEEKIVFEKNSANLQRFAIFFPMSLSIFFFLFRSVGRWVGSRSGILFYSFLVLFLFGLVAVVPSSIGDALGRVVVVLSVSLIPAYLYSFLSRTRTGFGTSLVGRAYLFFLYAAGSLNVLLCFVGLLFDVPNFLSEYLAAGIFYYLGISLVVILCRDIVFRAMKKDSGGSKVNLSLISTLSFAPLFLFYVFPNGWSVPFPLVVLFTLLPILGILHLLVLSRLLSYRYKPQQQVVYFFVSAVLSFTIVLITLMSQFIPMHILIGYTFLLIYSLLPLVEEVLSAMKRQDKHTDALALFCAVEDERENISAFIHDTVVQDVIYSMKRVEESGERAVKKEALRILDEVVFYLRELCSDIYPLLIQEMGLKTALLSMANKLERKHLVVISCFIPADKINFSLQKDNFILRSVKEFINNSIKHGKASEIFLSVTKVKGVYSFQVTDNGNYVAREKDNDPHFGLGVITEKLALLGGSLSVETEGWTRVTMKVPFVDKEGNGR